MPKLRNIWHSEPPRKPRKSNPSATLLRRHSHLPLLFLPLAVISAPRCHSRSLLSGNPVFAQAQKHLAPRTPRKATQIQPRYHTPPPSFLPSTDHSRPPLSFPQSFKRESIQPIPPNPRVETPNLGVFTPMSGASFPKPLLRPAALHPQQGQPEMPTGWSTTTPKYPSIPSRYDPRYNISFTSNLFGFRLKGRNDSGGKNWIPA